MLKNVLRAFCCVFPLVNAAIRGVSFYGLETPLKDFVCSWQHRPDYYISQLKELGFNHLRVPFSVEWVWGGDFSKMNEIIDSATQHGMHVTLDLHRVWSSHQSPHPTAEVSLDTFIDAWIRVLSRYKDNLTVVALDVFNEDQREDVVAHNNDFRAILVELEKRFPGRFIYLVGGIRWGGVLRDVSVEELPFSDRIRYTAHRYSFASSTSVEAELDYVLGGYARDKCEGLFGNKVGIGEWSTSGNQVWADRFVSYLSKNGIHDNFHWTIAHSHDTNNLWQDDCETLNWNEINTVKKTWVSEPTRNLLRG